MDLLRSSANGWASNKLVLAFIFAGTLALGGLAQGKDSGVGVATVSLANLPVQAQRTEALIRSGGPFAYSKDGVVFGNRERILPARQRGFYREYTVPTPGERSRGARRIVCGGKAATQPDACYYTADHYASFSRIVP